MKTVSLLLLLGLLANTVVAQIPPPQDLTASDGVYEKYVLVRWKAEADVDGYKVFRRAHPTYGNFQEISENWQRSTWLCDYGALPGVTYYYTVVASHNGIASEMAELNSGYVSAPPVAIDDNAVTSTELHATEPDFSLDISDARTTAASYRAGQQVAFNYLITNRYENPIARTEIRYFLSRDENYDWGDIALDETPKTYSDFPAASEYRLKAEVKLPDDLAPGRYYLLVVSAVHGNLSRLRLLHIPVDITP